MVGGHTRNIGKTSVIESIISALPDLKWTAVKVTQFGHGVCSIDGQACSCQTGEHSFLITSEHSRDSGTDTARFLAAGAKRSLWVRTRQGDLVSALPTIRKEIEHDDYVIVESNSLRRFIKPSLYLQVIDQHSTDFKESAQQFFDLADAYLLVAAPSASPPGPPRLTASLLSRELRKGKPCLIVSAEDRFFSEEVMAFVRSALVN
jgi:molybdopterin-guanine dinucleotide biosynthesis protein